MINMAKEMSDFLRESDAQMPTDKAIGKTVEYPDNIWR